MDSVWRACASTWHHWADAGQTTNELLTENIMNLSMHRTMTRPGTFACAISAANVLSASVRTLKGEQEVCPRLV